jgi:hypothetical protein
MRKHMVDTKCPCCEKEFTVELTEQGNIVTWLLTPISCVEATKE